MKITVNEQPQQFYLAMKNKWVPAAGHGIKVGEYQFCAVPVGDKINVSEVTTGAKVYTIPVNFAIDALTETKEGTIQFCYEIGESLERIINKEDNFDLVLEDIKKITLDRLGEMPEIENVEVSQ